MHLMGYDVGWRVVSDMPLREARGALMDDIVVVGGNIGQRLNNVDLYLLLYLIPQDFYSAWEATHGIF